MQLRTSRQTQMLLLLLRQPKTGCCSVSPAPFGCHRSRCSRQSFSQPSWCASLCENVMPAQYERIQLARDSACIGAEVLTQPMPMLPQVLLMSKAEFVEYAAPAQRGARPGGSSGSGSQSFPSLLDMGMLQGAAQDDPDFCSDVCSVLLAALSKRVKLYAPAEAAAQAAGASASYRLQCAAQVTTKCLGTLCRYSCDTSWRDTQGSECVKSIMLLVLLHRCARGSWPSCHKLHGGWCGCSTRWRKKTTAMPRTAVGRRVAAGQIMTERLQTRNSSRQWTAVQSELGLVLTDCNHPDVHFTKGLGAGTTSWRTFAV